MCLALLCLQGCAGTNVRTTPAPPEPVLDDPWEPFNRRVHRFNDALDRRLIGPVARGYQRTVPAFGRDRFRQFSRNLRTPVFAANELLQGDWRDARIAATRFVVNTTLGLGGLFDVAAREFELAYQPEDFGQTLAVHGVPAGRYLVLPLIGPTTFRHLAGRIVDISMHPLNFVEIESEAGTRAAIAILTGLDTRARAEPIIADIMASADPYAGLRALYAQNRANEIHEDADPYANLPEFEE